MFAYYGLCDFVVRSLATLTVATGANGAHLSNRIESCMCGRASERGMTSNGWFRSQSAGSLEDSNAPSLSTASEVSGRALKVSEMLACGLVHDKYQRSAL